MMSVMGSYDYDYSTGTGAKGLRAWYRLAPNMDGDNYAAGLNGSTSILLNSLSF